MLNSWEIFSQLVGKPTIFPCVIVKHFTISLYNCHPLTPLQNAHIHQAPFSTQRSLSSTYYPNDIIRHPQIPNSPFPLLTLPLLSPTPRVSPSLYTHTSYQVHHTQLLHTPSAAPSPHTHRTRCLQINPPAFAIARAFASRYYTAHPAPLARARAIT